MKRLLQAIPWRDLFARLPLPMLALAASYGVAQFAVLFVPLWVAVIQAAAFELTYIGLSITRGLSPEQRRRATWISAGAVTVSILYNSLAGLFHRNPAWLVDLWWPYEIGLAILHGAPLALVAYLVSDLLLHAEPAAPQPATDGALTAALAQERATPARVVAQTVEVPAPDLLTLVQRLRSQDVTWRTVSAILDKPESTLRRWVATQDTIKTNGHLTGAEV